jgi:hypothetical protein
MDTSALLAVPRCSDPAKFPELLGRMRELIEDNALQFPKAVVQEVEVLARGDPIMYWAIGLGKTINKFSADVDHKLAVMNMFQSEMGYDTGLEDMDGSDPTIVELAAVCHMFHQIHMEFWMISEDWGTAPLKPTMEEVCAHTGWNMLGIRDGLKSLGLEDYLLQ